MIMARPTVYFAITSHGFGHACRTAAIAAELQRLNPEVLLIFGTTVPRALLAAYIPGDFIQRSRSLDVGVIQADSLQMDRRGTLEKNQQLQQRQPQLLQQEADFLSLNEVDLIFADAPPLAAPLGKMVGIPCWYASNFGWDFIYGQWPEFSEIIPWIQDCYGQSDRLFQLPLCEPMAAFPYREPVGLVGGIPKFTAQELAGRLSLNPQRKKTILLTFGGLGLEQIPYGNVQRFPQWQFITFDRQAPQNFENLTLVGDPTMRPVDVLPLCDLVVSKPGFSTFAEVLLQDKPLISITRENFIESHYLLAGLQRSGHHQIIPPEALFQGSWEFLDHPLIPPSEPGSIHKNGTQAIAQEIHQFLKGET